MMRPAKLCWIRAIELKDTCLSHPVSAILTYQVLWIQYT